MKVYLGWDSNEQEAYRVAETTLRHTSDLIAEPLAAERLASNGLLRRMVDTRGQAYDLPSNAPCSTEFAASRFLVPILCQKGWALFTDCDVVFLENVRKILNHADPSYAVQVVKHNHAGTEQQKMGGMAQTQYPRKNWSSVMLFNCDHSANRRLTLDDVSNRPGRDLHRFYWLADSEIGSLPMEYNWLVGVEPKPAKPCIAHFTLGGPWIPDWPGAEHDELWLMASRLK